MPKKEVVGRKVGSGDIFGVFGRPLPGVNLGFR
jgi:hypothetical protein